MRTRPCLSDRLVLYSIPTPDAKQFPFFASHAPAFRIANQHGREKHGDNDPQQRGQIVPTVLPWVSHNAGLFVFLSRKKVRMPRAQVYPFAVGTRLSSETHAQLLVLAAVRHVTVSELLRLLVERACSADQEEEKNVREPKP